MKELKITKGTWRYEDVNGCKDIFSDVYDYAIAEIDSSAGDAVAFTCGVENDEEDLANAQLIAEAGTVANKCGLTPKELLEQVEHSKEVIEELVKALELITDTYSEYGNEFVISLGNTHPFIQAKQLIQKHRNNEKQG